MAEFFAHPIPAVIILLGLLVFVHELGHFVVGRLAGIAVETFSIGFGPRILSFRHRGTEYCLSWIPLGGYVKFAGAHPGEDIPKGLPGRPFRSTSLPKRAATVVAGPLANFILAIVVFTVLGATGISHPPATIGEVIAGSAAERAGVEAGDRFVSIDGKPVEMWSDLEQAISSAPGKELTITIQRGERTLDVKLTPTPTEAQDLLGKTVTVGRAGVALGRQPPVVTPILPDTQLGATGLVSGARVVAAGGKEIQSFTELEQAVFQAYGERRDLDVEVEIPGAAKSPATIRTSAELAGLDRANATPDAVMHALGLVDGQLTISKIDGANASALQVGDRIQSWNGDPIANFYELSERLVNKPVPDATIVVLRKAEPVEVKIALTPIEIQKPDGAATYYQLPVAFYGQPEAPEPIIERYAGLSALGYGFAETGRQTGELVATVARLFSGDIPIKALGGPMLIAKVAGDSAKHGWQTFLSSMALISINLGLLNMFPIPVLDGGQLLLMGAEAVRRKPLREAAIENFQKVGFAMIVALVMLATYNDLSRFWKSMLSSLVGLFQ